jgi:hypothetical protein
LIFRGLKLRAFTFFVLIKAGLKSFEFTLEKKHEPTLMEMEALAREQGELERGQESYINEIFAFRSHLLLKEKIYLDEARKRAKESGLLNKNNYFDVDFLYITGIILPRLLFLFIRLDVFSRLFSALLFFLLLYLNTFLKYFMEVFSLYTIAFYDLNIENLNNLVSFTTVPISLKCFITIGFLFLKNKQYYYKKKLFYNNIVYCPKILYTISFGKPFFSHFLKNSFKNFLKKAFDLFFINYFFFHNKHKLLRQFLFALDEEI